MFFILLLNGICFGGEGSGPETFVGLGAQQISYDSVYRDQGSLGAFLQFTLPIMNNLATYMDLSILGGKEPSEALREDFIDTWGSDPNISWNRYRIDLSLGNEMRTRGLIDNYVRFGGELEAEFQPSMYETLNSQNTFVEFTTHTRLGLFLDFGTEVPVNENNLQFSLNFGYLFAIYTGGGALRDESSSIPNQTELEVINYNEGQNFDHADFIGNRYFAGAELYYDFPIISLFLQCRIGFRKPSDYGRYRAEYYGGLSDLKDTRSLQLGAGLGYRFR